MCPIPPLLSADSSDEFVVMFLDSRSVDDPVPSNVITDVNPFTIDPRLSSGDKWYMHESIILDTVDERSTIKGNSGCWEFINNISISMPTSNRTIGRKITRKFLLGNGTSGDKTTFGMHEYLVEQDKNKFKETRLSRIFSQVDEVKNEEESGTGRGENTESKLPFLVNQQERNTSLKQCENEFQASNGIEGQLELPNYVMNEEAGQGDFIELKDIFGPEDGNSSFSGNTSVKSMTSDENFDSEIMGFDPEAMIRDIANDINNANASVSSDPAVIRPSISPVPGVVRKGKSEASTSSSSESSGDGTSAKHSGNGTSYKRAKSRSARRMAKLGKRYCCFIR